MSFTGYQNLGGGGGNNLNSGGGGGFLSNDPMSPSSPNNNNNSNSNNDGTRKRGSNKSRTPLSIKQVLTASSDPTDDGSFVVDGKVLGQVTLVALVLDASEQTGFVNLRVDDGSGQLDVRFWFDQNEDPRKAEERRKWVPGVYVRVAGYLRVFQGRKNVHAHFVRVVDDMNELTFHIAETIAVHMKNSGAAQKGKALDPGAGYGSGFTASDAVGGSNGANQQIQGAAFNASDSSLNPSEFTEVQFAVINFIMRMSMSSDSGPHIDEVVKQLEGKFQQNEIRSAVQWLSDEGRLYSTIDEEHFKFAQT